MDKLVLQVEALVKQYPGTFACNHVNFDVQVGEVHALVGENGAGKSTLAKIISGAQRRSSGIMRLDGEVVDWLQPAQAQACGISIVHQELDLIPTLSGAENIFLGQSRHYRAGILNWATQRKAAQEITERLGIHVPLDKPVQTLSLAEQQLITIAKALSVPQPRLIIMDEPTSALAHHEIDQLFSIIHRLKSQQVSFIYISHHLSELFQIADRVTVMRDGRNVLTSSIGEVSVDDIALAMVGHEVQTTLSSKKSLQDKPCIQVTSLSSGKVLHNVNFSVNKGEIVGFTGLMGCGSLELARVLFGMVKVQQGSIVLGGETVDLKSPMHAVQQGIAFVPEDRKTQGIIPRSSVRFNIALPIIRKLAQFGIVNRQQERSKVEEHVANLRVRTSSIEKQVRFLSGGNQQKVVLAKSMVSEPKMLVLVEPTRGVDVGAKADVK
jgi:ABC-type sugar transport system ATPase subunit